MLNQPPTDSGSGPDNRSDLKPLAECGSKDSHGTPRLRLVLRASEALGEGPGLYRILDPDPPHKFVGVSVTADCARRLLQEEKVRLVRSAKRVRGICPIFHSRDPVKRVVIHGQSLGKPRRQGPNWVQPELPDWCWHEIFYAVMNSVSSRPLEPWTWDEIVSTVKQPTGEHRHQDKPLIREPLEPVQDRRLCPPLKIAA